MVNLTFTRELRLLTPNDFKYVFQQPLRASTPQLTILSRPNQLGYARIGLAVAKKNAKRAHDRNRIKRIARESFRLQQYSLPAMDFVIIAKNGIMQLDNQMLRNSLDKLWQRHRRLASKH